MSADYIAASRDAVLRLAADRAYPPLFERITDALVSALKAGNKILLAGNGGSAADSQHIAGELVVRFRADRPALSAIALTVDTSVLTACLNDCGPEAVFARQVAALGAPGDILWVFSTSGKSPNILAAVRAARAAGMKVLAFSGGDGGELAGMADLCFLAPSAVTSHIQECHIIVGHMLCLAIEERAFR